MNNPSGIPDVLRFRADLYASFGRRPDALFELTEAALMAGLVPSLAHLSLEGAHRRGWGSLYAALDRGTVNADALRDALARSLATAPKACGRSPGRPKGKLMGKAPRHSVIKKAA